MSTRSAGSGERKTDAETTRAAEGDDSTENKRTAQQTLRSDRIVRVSIRAHRGAVHLSLRRKTGRKRSLSQEERCSQECGSSAVRLCGVELPLVPLRCPLAPLCVRPLFLTLPFSSRRALCTERTATGGRRQYTQHRTAHTHTQRRRTRNTARRDHQTLHQHTRGRFSALESTHRRGVESPQRHPRPWCLT